VENILKMPKLVEIEQLQKRKGDKKERKKKKVFEKMK
jgi:hypothetical protein